MDCCGNKPVCNNGTCVCMSCGNITADESYALPEDQQKQEKEMPSMFQQAKNFAKATVRHVANMGRNTPKMVRESRLEICNKCDKNNNGRCSECGCFVDVKTSWASEACPLGHWLEYKDTPGKCGGCGRK
jgi:hypothetical protein